MRVLRYAVIALLAAACAAAPHAPPIDHKASAPRRMVVVNEQDVKVDQPPPHGAIGMSTAYRISDVAPARTMEFRRRTLHVGAAIGEHPIDHDEVYYVLAGEGEVISDGEAVLLKPGMAAYLYDGSVVGIKQIGDQALDLIISYPLKQKDKPVLIPTVREPD